MNDSCEVEVVWECDSPKPSTWKKFQAPRATTELSPVPTKRFLTAKRKVSTDDGPTMSQYEQSKRGVAMFLNEWQKATKKNEEQHSFVPNIQDKFTDSESDEEMCNGVPKFNQSSNNSIDLIFNLSGNAENASFTSPPTNCNVVANESSTPNKDIDESWGDDDMFMNNMSKLESMDTTKGSVSCSTPYHRKVATKRNNCKKEQGKNEANKSAIIECAEIFLTNPKERKKPPPKLKTNAVDSGISEEILSQLMMDDSWCDKSLVKTPDKPQCSRSTSNFTHKYEPKNPQSIKPQPSKFIHKYETNVATKKNNITNGHKNVDDCVKLSNNLDTFSDDDDDMLIEAAVLTESQEQVKQNPIKKSPPVPAVRIIKKPSHVHIQNPPVKPTKPSSKYSAQEIERKKQEALRRKMNRNQKK